MKQSLKATTAGQEKARLSAAYTATSSAINLNDLLPKFFSWNLKVKIPKGMKLPILIIIPARKSISDYTPPDNVSVLYKTGATFDIICNYIRHNFLNEHGLGNNKATLFLDSAPCHLTDALKDTFKEKSCNREIIKKRYRNMHQPFDVCIFAPVKRQLRGKWYLFENKSYTVHGNLRSPGYTTVK